ncbi:MAG: hypothetical protein QXW58_06995, partial [Thermosphaera sp.]
PLILPMEAMVALGKISWEEVLDKGLILSLSLTVSQPVKSLNSLSLYSTGIVSLCLDMKTSADIFI